MRLDIGLREANRGTESNAPHDPQTVRGVVR